MIGVQLEIYHQEMDKFAFESLYFQHSLNPRIISIPITKMQVNKLPVLHIFLEKIFKS